VCPTPLLVSTLVLSPGPPPPAPYDPLYLSPPPPPHPLRLIEERVDLHVVICMPPTFHSASAGMSRGKKPLGHSTALDCGRARRLNRGGSSARPSISVRSQNGRAASTTSLFVRLRQHQRQSSSPRSARHHRLTRRQKKRVRLTLASCTGRCPIPPLAPKIMRFEPSSSACRLALAVQSLVHCASPPVFPRSAFRRDRIIGVQGSIFGVKGRTSGFSRIDA